LSASKQIPLAHQNVADPIIGNRKIALPVRIACVRPRQPLFDRKSRLIGFQRLGQIPLANHNVADLSVGNRKIALGPGTVGGASRACECARRIRERTTYPPKVTEVDPNPKGVGI